MNETGMIGTRQMERVLSHARDAGAKVVLVVAGMILWAVFAGIVARAVPASWQCPEKMAGRTLAMSMREAGKA